MISLQQICEQIDSLKEQISSLEIQILELEKEWDYDQALMVAQMGACMSGDGGYSAPVSPAQPLRETVAQLRDKIRDLQLQGLRINIEARHAPELHGAGWLRRLLAKRRIESEFAREARKLVGSF